MAALVAHRDDRHAMAKNGRLSMFSHVRPDDMPLIGVIDERWHRTLVKQRLAQAGSISALEDDDTGGLSASGLYVILKRFFKLCAVRAGSDNSDFSKASTHWLRHTFAHHALQVTEKDLGVVQQLLGHASIATTAIYTKADLQSRVDAVARIQTAV